jgi:hypothetical protein
MFLKSCLESRVIGNLPGKDRRTSAGLLVAPRQGVSPAPSRSAQRPRRQKYASSVPATPAAISMPDAMLRTQKVEAVVFHALEKTLGSPAAEASWQLEFPLSLGCRMGRVMSVQYRSFVGSQSGSDCGLFGWFDKFEVDSQHPQNAVFFIAKPDLIFQCFCVVLPYSLNCVSPN